jgi:hypothetical protein
MLGHSIVSQHFMEPEGSLPNSQQLSTCYYPEPEKSSPQYPILSRIEGRPPGLDGSCEYSEYQPRTNDKGWSSSLGVNVTKHWYGLRTCTDSGATQHSEILGQLSNYWLLMKDSAP